MKNKRWKRKAKRIKGYCSEDGTLCEIGDLKVCKYYDECMRLNCIYAPWVIGIRELEQLCKGDK